MALLKAGAGKDGPYRDDPEFQHRRASEKRKALQSKPSLQPGVACPCNLKPTCLHDTVVSKQSVSEAV